MQCRQFPVTAGVKTGRTTLFGPTCTRIQQKVYFLKVHFPKVYFPNVYSPKVYLSKVYILKVYSPEVYFSKVYFWEMHPTCMSSKLYEFICKLALTVVPH